MEHCLCVIFTYILNSHTYHYSNVVFQKFFAVIFAYLLFFHTSKIFEDFRGSRNTTSPSSCYHLTPLPKVCPSITNQPLLPGEISSGNPRVVIVFIKKRFTIKIHLGGTMLCVIFTYILNSLISLDLTM